MITLEMCLDYLESPNRPIWGEIYKNKYPVTLSKAQKKFLGNLCEGKITDTPRCFGKTFIIKLYCECLDYYTDMVKYDSNIGKDDYISLAETIDAWKEYGINPYDIKHIANEYKANSTITMREYNFTEEDIEEWMG